MALAYADGAMAYVGLAASFIVVLKVRIEDTPYAGHIWVRKSSPLAA